MMGGTLEEKKETALTETVIKFCIFAARKIS